MAPHGLFTLLRHRMSRDRACALNIDPRYARRGIVSATLYWLRKAQQHQQPYPYGDIDTPHWHLFRLHLLFSFLCRLVSVTSLPAPCSRARYITT